ncbi:methylated-DNA--[protein]-cysteine S-methyltransferase [Halomonas cupida]|uniref:methylated-DNA--[protein]-cysteine S-methyltransferase n=1 Tax=Halomonas cupida TaxID=44933 RepID=UPI003A8F00CF
MKHNDWQQYAGLECYQPPASEALGSVVIAATTRGIARLDFMDNDQVSQLSQRPSDLTRACRTQLEEYFAGHRQQFDLPLDAAGTDFQQQVWQALSRIPYGETRSYGELAEGLGRKGAQRAIGAANGRNPIAIIVPCHRVIGSDGSLTGYAGGIGRKQWLLAFEAQEVPLELQPG